MTKIVTTLWLCDSWLGVRKGRMQASQQLLLENNQTYGWTYGSKRLNVTYQRSHRHRNPLNGQMILWPYYCCGCCCGGSGSSKISGVSLCPRISATHQDLCVPGSWVSQRAHISALEYLSPSCLPPTATPPTPCYLLGTMIRIDISLPYWVTPFFLSKTKN